MGAPDVFELGFVGESQGVDGGFGRRRCDFDACVPPAAASPAVARSAIWFWLRRRFVARPRNEVELTEWGRQQRIGVIVEHPVEPEHAMADSQPLIFPARRVGGWMTIEIALVRGDRDPLGMLDHDLATPAPGPG